MTSADYLVAAGGILLLTLGAGALMGWIAKVGGTMEALIKEIVQKLHSLPKVKILEVLDFVEFLAWNKERLNLQQLEDDAVQGDEAFEALADHLADEFKRYAGDIVPVLSDDAVSRAGIYEEHP
ncbi:hypothetical protein [Microcoleus sp. FACHB-68]|uniref:hypothetical protein n=1 Tax=Microcoleus sp. FACHB-68 TaxID=2692826 RepID=UPI001687AB63|nr:hypothetical protein [Microcoleus sp. FACHB-68]MBD1939304.1 hypothetical protein [Microcoleus sp. FACHB-68]